MRLEGWGRPPPSSRRLRRLLRVRADINYLITSGLTGEPTAPVIGMAGATNRNS